MPNPFDQHCRPHPLHARTRHSPIGRAKGVPISPILAATVRILAGLWLLGGPIPAGQGQLKPSHPVALADLHATPRLLSQRQAALPGQTVMLAIDLTIDKGWHTYWPGFNDSGFALQTKITTSSNATAGRLIWPAPHRYSPAKGILDHVFLEHETVLVPLTINPDARLGDDVSVTIDLNWLVCKTSCLPESAMVSIHLVVADAQSRPDKETTEVFARAQARLPQPITPDDGISLDWKSKTLRIHARGAAQLAFYPREDSRPPRNLLADGFVQSDTLRLTFRDGDHPIRGVLEVWDHLPTTKHPSPTSHLYLVQLPATANQTTDYTPLDSMKDNPH